MVRAGEQVRFTYLTVLPAGNWVRKCCHKVHALCSSGQCGLRTVCAVRSTGLIILVISRAPAGNVVLEADTLR